MVTHNPELAETYSTRIIRMLDGVIINDSMPLTEEELPVAEVKPVEKKKQKKPSMSFATAFGLSLKNLFTKKGRTVLTSFAGSIGIIGIALIFAVSHGLSTYIDTMQEDTLSSYPLSIQQTHADFGSLMVSFMGAAQSAHDHEMDAVYTKSAIYDMINALNNMEKSKNDLKSFKVFIEEEWAKKKEEGGLEEALNGIKYSYNLDLLIYTKNIDGNIIQSDASKLMQEMIMEHMKLDLSYMNSFQGGSGMMSMMPSGGSGMTLWQEMLPGKDGDLINPLLKKQYDLVEGKWPTAYNEIVLVLDENNELDDMTLYALGLKSKEDIDAIMQAAVNQTDIDRDIERWTYEEIFAMEFRTILNANCFAFDEMTGTYTDLRETDAGLRYLYDNGTVLKVTGIIRPNEEAVSAMLTGSIGYTHKLTEYVITESSKAAAVEAQKKDTAVDIFSGLPFKENTGNLTDAEKEAEFRTYISGLDENGKAMAFTKITCIPSEEWLSQMITP